MIFRGDIATIANGGLLDGITVKVVSTMLGIASVELQENGPEGWRIGDKMDLPIPELKEAQAPFIIDQGDPGWLPLKLRDDI